MRRQLLTLLTLAACASPSIEYTGAPSRALSVNSWEITVFRRADRVQAIRTNTVWGASKQDMQINGAIAITEVTGCRVDRRSFTGDAVILNAKLICDPR